MLLGHEAGPPNVDEGRAVEVAQEPDRRRRVLVRQGSIGEVDELAAVLIRE
jgi:hypothetical protein